MRLEQFAGRLDALSEEVQGLGRDACEATIGIAAQANWSGNAAEAYLSYCRDKSAAVASLAGPLHEIAPELLRVLRRAWHTCPFQWTSGSKYRGVHAPGDRPCSLCLRFVFPPCAAVGGRRARGRRRAADRCSCVRACDHQPGYRRTWWQ
ncbi:MAG: WXG100 family type VII secretion target [Actinocrinis sp.]